MNAFKLKLLATLFMTIDHFGIVLNLLFRYKIAGIKFDHYMTDDFWQMRFMGRMAFPIFCFLIAEGCAHTGDLKKYIGRLAVFAIISQIPYRMFQIARTGFGVGWGDLFQYASGNVLITLTFGAIATFLYMKLFETGKNIFYVFLCKTLLIAGIVASFKVAELLRGEYGLYGVVTILLVYAFRAKDDSDHDIKIWGSKYAQILCCAIPTLIYYMGDWFYAIGAILSVLPLLFYNQKPGCRKLKWLFYIYYPAHMAMLSALIYFILKA